MSEMKHTPGPWFIREGRNSIYCSRNGLTYTLAIVEDGSVLRDSCEANKRLIAAAPELLEACVLALKYVCHESKDIQHDEHGNIVINPARRLAQATVKVTLRNAIKKAKGEK